MSYLGFVKLYLFLYKKYGRDLIFLQIFVQELFRNYNRRSFEMFR